MKARRGILGAVTVLALLVLAACGSDSPSATDPTPTGSAAPSPTRHTETEWTIETPAGWIRTDITKDADATKAVRYAGADGRYVLVAINPQGSGYDSDAVWRYEVNGGRFEIVGKDDCKGGEGCSTSDNRYDVYVFAKNTSEAPKVGGNVYYFAFGDTDSTTIDAAEFEKIIESIEAK